MFGRGYVRGKETRIEARKRDYTEPSGKHDLLESKLQGQIDHDIVTPVKSAMGSREPFGIGIKFRNMRTATHS